MKSTLGRLDFPHEAFSNLEVGLMALCTTPLPLTHVHASGVHALPAVHRDPFDRLLIAQAAAEGLTIVTADEMIPKYPGVKTLWS